MCEHNKDWNILRLVKGTERYVFYMMMKAEQKR